MPAGVGRHTKEGGRGRRFKINNQEREEFVYGSCIIKYEESAM